MVKSILNFLLAREASTGFLVPLIKGDLGGSKMLDLITSNLRY